jgi:hypothetical protein
MIRVDATSTGVPRADIHLQGCCLAVAVAVAAAAASIRIDNSIAANVRTSRLGRTAPSMHSSRLLLPLIL